MEPWSRTRKTTSTWLLTMKANVLSHGPGTAAAAVSYVFKLDCYPAADLRYLRCESMKKSTEKSREDFNGKVKRNRDFNRKAKRKWRFQSKSKDSKEN